MKHKFVAGLFSVGVIATLVLGMSVMADEDISGTLTLAHHRTDLEPQVEELVEDFMEEYPNVKIDLEFLADYESAIPIRITGGEAPDVFELDFDRFPMEYWPEYFLPQDDLSLKGNVVCGENYMIDGVIYGYPEDVIYYGFMYNKALWKEAGIEEEPTTIDELIADLEKLSQLDGVIPLTTMYKTGWAIKLWYECYCATYCAGDTGSIYNYMGENDSPFSNETMQTIMNAFRTMREKGLLDPDLMSSDWDLQAADFAAGTIGTYLIGTYADATMTTLGFPGEDIGFFAFPNPDGSGENSSYVFGDFAMVISKDCEYPEAAKAFVEYYTRHFAKKCGMVTPMLGEESELSSLDGMLATNPALFYRANDSVDYTEINKIATFSPAEFVQEYLVAEDPQTVIDSYNEKWNAAREEYLASK